MPSEPPTDAVWRKRLGEELYRVLRQGEMEEPNTGDYVATTNDGTYRCRGCGSTLFHSRDKVNDGSGYATFTDPVREDAVRVEATYTDEGNTVTRLVCNVCDGRVGRLSDISLRSDQDLTEGAVQHSYHVSSKAVRFHKALTVRNYPIGALLVLLSLLAGGLFAWSWGTSLIETATLSHTSEGIPLWIGDSPYTAHVVHLDTLEPTSGSLLADGEVLLVVLGNIAGVPRIRYANQPVDMLWLNSNFTVVGAVTAADPQSGAPLVIPEGASYLLIIKTGLLSSSAFQLGNSVIVTDKSTLL